MKKTVKLLNTIRQILEGRQLIPNDIKFRLLALSAGFIHLIFCINMYRMGATIMFIYNIFIVIGYWYMGIVLASKEKYGLISVLTIIEIELHSTLATFLMGSEFLFMLYTVAMVPAAFYLTSTFAKGLAHIRYSVFFSAIVIICYIIVAVYQPYVNVLYDTSAYAGLVRKMRYGNMLIGFFLQLIFSLLFALESGYMSQLLERENVKLGEEASIDPLTRLWNRRSLTRAVTETIDTMERVDLFSVVMLDIDDFKHVNDTYGHDTGDDVLVALADIIREQVRDGDYSCRWGGEEFLLFAHGPKHEVHNLAERIRTGLGGCKFSDKRGGSFQVTLTAGVAEYRYGMQFRTSVEIADKRLYHGKTHGKNQTVSG